jgi:MoaA/NifB/PqqE/SkfB family radical SAM enzyme
MAIDISGSCNGMCPYCSTGRLNRRQGSPVPGRHMTLHEFTSLLDDLTRRKILEPCSIIDLYNWHEPLMSPHFVAIAQYLSRSDFEYTVSTNASLARAFHEADDLRGLTALIFSMPGFSQDSYDRVHGLSFPSVLDNIKSMLSNFRMHGFKGEAKIAFHVYQFNIGEIKPAKAFAETLDLGFYPFFAIPAELDTCIDYNLGRLPASMLDAFSRDLMLFYIKDLLRQRPADYVCNQSRFLAVDEFGMLLLGCCADSHSRYAAETYVLGDIRKMSLDEIKLSKERAKSSETCRLCQESRSDYLGGICGKKLVDELGGIDI